MGGKMSRNKGARNERLLVEHLKGLGYAALRVPLSGAMKGYAYDVTAEKGGEMSTFELKVRANEYAKIYHAFRTFNEGGIYRAEFDGRCFAMSDDFEKVRVLKGGSFPVSTDRTTKKIMGMKAYLKGADYLVIRGDRLGWLFVRYL